MAGNKARKQAAVDGEHVAVKPRDILPATAAAEVSPARVEKLAAIGLSDAEIAAACALPLRQIKSRPFAAAVRQGRGQLAVRLRARALQEALDGNATLLKHLGQELLEQVDKRPAAQNQPPPKAYINVRMEDV